MHPNKINALHEHKRHLLARFYNKNRCKIRLHMEETVKTTTYVELRDLLKEKNNSTLLQKRLSYN